MNAAVKHPLQVGAPTLKDAMRQVAGGVCVITAGRRRRANGFDGDFRRFAFGRSADDDRLRQSAGVGLADHRIASALLRQRAGRAPWACRRPLCRSRRDKRQLSLRWGEVAPAGDGRASAGRRSGHDRLRGRGIYRAAQPRHRHRRRACARGPSGQAAHLWAGPLRDARASLIVFVFYWEIWARDRQRRHSAAIGACAAVSISTRRLMSSQRCGGYRGRQVARGRVRGRRRKARSRAYPARRRTRPILEERAMGRHRSEGLWRSGRVSSRRWPR